MNKLKEIEGRYFKECNVVMLPTENENVGIYQNPVPEIEVLHYWNKRISNSYIAQHLYITSDDEIKEGDWFISSERQVYQAIRDNFSDLFSILKDLNNNTIWKSKGKIIATTDKSLKEVIKNHNDFDSIYNLPQPSHKFIKKYCELGSNIDKVLVEYESKGCILKNGVCADYLTDECKDEGYRCYKLKTDSHNTITIKEVKEKMYSESFVIWYSGMQKHKIENAHKRWVKENL